MSSDRCHCAWEGTKDKDTTRAAQGAVGGLTPGRPGEGDVDSGSFRAGEDRSVLGAGRG